MFPSKQFSADTYKIIESVTGSTIKLWNKVKSQLLPTPAKFHYVFNLRDVSRIFKGMVQVTSNTVNKVDRLNKSEIKPEVFTIALWKHECERVFVDKLISVKDKEMTMNFINESTVESFPQYEADILEKLCTKSMYFVDFMAEDVRDDDGMIIEEGPKIYEALWDINIVRKRCDELLEIYNEKFPAKKMNLVLFDDA